MVSSIPIEYELFGKRFMLSSIPIKRKNIYNWMVSSIFIKWKNVYSFVWFQVIISNANDLYSVVWFQVFQLNMNYLGKVLCFQVFLSKEKKYIQLDGFKYFYQLQKCLHICMVPSIPIKYKWFVFSCMVLIFFYQIQIISTPLNSFK